MITTRCGVLIRCLIYIVIVLICGCSVFAPSVKMRSLALEVAPQANDDTPIAIDFVVVNDASVLQTLLTTNATQWFEQRAQFQRDNPTTLKVWSLELVPGQRVSFDKVPVAGEKALALLAFAGYHDAGSHRLRLDNTRDVIIRLDSKDLHVQTGG